MANEIEINPEAIIDAGDNLVASAQRIRAAITSFDAELAAFGAPWGSDDLGSLIGMVYETIRDLALESYDANLVEIEDIGKLSRVMGLNYQQTERAIVEHLGRFGEMFS
ncbi:hypothetical protein O7631_25625 [Micromonospora sp. WMMD967]|uniref:hypothetical protein n=1 Tax=Micromonospora sp. WMMD967 TaxID=3016101 RepID=UPI00241708BE|nr:hypothetical protein [Micromonospora sp. WMMD967]MDG4839923.1 hypothetical protein [Micromonospora sp. WMMD967]